MDMRGFGGFSGIALSENGADFSAITDQGYIGRGRITRSDGAISDVTLDSFRRLLGPTRAPLADDFTDSEGLAIGPDGQIFVSFEGPAGLRTFADVDAPGSELMTTAAFAAMQKNVALEALAIGPDGALFTIPERSGRATAPFPVFRFKDGAWDQPFEVPRRGPYLVAGADIGPDGRLYLLERDFVGIGFRTRVRRFSPDGSGEELILETAARIHDNLEGIAVWQDAQGLRMTMISDDNFLAIQKTEIVEYRLTD